ncbi:hypothetical protein L1987_85687 [Smallanthus sonchifolius]|uniref:Uncharacterized protein n=1 Tax=Smallanthus sonchifolius TaxID=185202 RepID=A0ACB8XX92_9ASTR|nr:hypothetical protein L1987_85687 [Smallanthus sonchifolius]
MNFRSSEQREQYWAYEPRKDKKEERKPTVEEEYGTNEASAESQENDFTTQNEHIENELPQEMFQTENQAVEAGS